MANFEEETDGIVGQLSEKFYCIILSILDISAYFG